MTTERALGVKGEPGLPQSPLKEATGQVNGERFMRRLLIREFSAPDSLADLPRSERKAFDSLIEAVRRWAEVYSVQEGPDEKAHFYPTRVTKSQILKASEQNPDILSPYTVVLRNDDGSFYTVPMHEAYSKIIETTNVIGLLKDATKTTKDKKLGNYLKAKIHAIKNGSWEEADRV